ncbi:MAG: toll/interleukin-1 receptor domain-containing protein [Pseudomonadota bacterium]|nr:toll/interleukin-1 receptor domain-containing protein [Pseudomonadota bacterium]MDP1906443.1 toll/interleukin-1 receptor domain-containing protein [Pseudomonadota bacterium]MDP2351288.1 toll/interleukin-1 receptor domain-containing protein [Pseudomonadota bacterium]
MRLHSLAQTGAIPLSIFISYRWGDTAAARLIWRQLVDHFGEDEVFLDREEFHAGDDFPQELVQAIAGAEVFLAVLGPEWVSGDQMRRLHDEHDFVRRELEQALLRRESGALLFIPVWMGHTPMPKLADLPSCLGKLHELLIGALDLGRHYQGDVVSLIGRIEAYCGGLLARRGRAWLLETLGNPDISRARFGQNLAVLAAGQEVVRRANALAALDDWWRDWPRKRQPFVLLGEEGDGKSWAIAAWLADLARKTECATPLLYVPAIHADSARMDDLLAKGYAGFAPSLDIARWERGLSSSLDQAPAALLVIDALNERSSLDWRHLFIQTPPWSGRVALVVVCRAAYWDKLSRQLDAPVTTWNLGGFDERELDAALSLHGMQRAAFRPEVLTLLAKPRYFEMARRLHGRIEEGGITAERLIYESWRSMYEHKLGDSRRLDHDEFLGLIRELAEKRETRVRPSEFAAILPPGPWQAGDMLDELTSARILSDRDGKIVLQADHLALGLGLLLAEVVEKGCEREPCALDEIIAKHTAGQATMELEVRIRGMALYHAMRRDDYPDAGRVALLRAWVESRNIAPEDLRHAADYLPLRPEAFLEMAAFLWGDADNREVQDAFMAGFLKYGRLEQVRRELIPAFTEWLGLFHLDGYRASYLDDQTKREEEHRQVVERLGGEVDDGTVLERFGYRLTATRNPGLLRLGQVAAAVISYADIAPYARAVATGLVAEAIMDGSSVEFNWLCRIASPDAVSALTRLGRELMELGQPSALLAARNSFSALGTAESIRLWAEIPVEYRPPNPLKQFYDERPCDSLWRWSEDNYLACLGYPQFHPDFVAKQLRDVALNPELTLPESANARLSLAGTGIDLSKVGRYKGMTSEEHSLEEIEPALCAYAPRRYAELIQALSREMAGCTGEARHMLAWRLYEHLPILDAANRQSLEVAWEGALNSEEDEDRWAEHVLYSVLLFDRPPREQCSWVMRRAHVDGCFREYEPRFRPLASADYPIVESALAVLKPGGPVLPICALLGYLDATLAHLSDAMRTQVLRHFASGDRAVRGYCLGLISHTRDQQAAAAIIAGGWRYLGDCPAKWEDVWGSLLLCHFAIDLPYLELAGRIAPEWWGYAVAQNGDRPEDLAAYAQLLDRTWRHIAGLPDTLECDGPTPKVEVRREWGLQVDIPEADYPGSYNLSINYQSWGGGSGNSSSDLFVRELSLEQQTLARQSAYRRVIDLIEAQQQNGNPWFASSFHHGQLRQVVKLDGAPWREWIAPVLSGNQAGKTLLSRCRGFYEKLAVALLNFAPSEGEKLFRVMRANQGVKLSDGESGLPILLLELFAAPDSEAVDTLRMELLDACTTDHELFELALMARLGQRESWLLGEIERRLILNWHFDQARALLLLGFAGTPEVEERLSRFCASQPDSWLGKVAESALNLHRRDTWARHWFNRFIEEQDRVSAWAAFRLFLACVDRRYLAWMPSTQLKEAETWKEDAFVANLATIRKAANKNEKAWKDRFLGEKTKPRQLWPWMGDYQDETRT